ncbi:MarR family winged helix-turn-helix transcriptional regulator [Nocardioides ungokensis]|uniref:MarR family winged helix-turn-helix transcriptional regulator n=1 Tax=Nocardioides ungokensis TaxID=1643322 RepID=UPI0015DFDC56|nr:MarR family transcriptional regulator [Nocardioides ungokensis]
MSADETPWLDDRQQQAWRAWLAMGSRLPAALNRQLQRDSDLSLQDFDVLVQLTDTEDGRVRVSALAAALGWERSRLSHHVTRMERRGLVAREECGDDGRGAFVVLTPEGRAAIEAAAPGHVRTVRSLVFDALTPAEVASLEAITSKVLGRLEDA